MTVRPSNYTKLSGKAVKIEKIARRIFKTKKIYEVFQIRGNCDKKLILLLKQL